MNLLEQSRRRLLELPVDPELLPGAANAVRVCLRVHPEEKVTLITDQACLEIAAALAVELDRVGAPFHPFILEDYAPRPLADMPRPVLEDLESSQVSIFAVRAQENELRTRMQMTEVVNRRRIRHAHMVNIERQIMLEGMRADYLAVDALSVRVFDVVTRARQIRARTPAGTDITATLTPEYRWLKTSGIISAQKWGNLPGGEVFTTPLEVNGVFVVDGVVGDYLCARYGSLRETPLTITVEGNRLKSVECANKELEAEFWKYTHTDENSDRVGEFAIGTNIGLRGVIGNILQDEKVPGIHVAFGNPYGAHTGAPWDSSTHIDVVGLHFDIWADDLQIMRDGQFLI
ncbi:MAG: aminopeptidase [Chloroherpetonaceae bacterium]|nr:aminopeptidase [Chthonomonadaceae bacterium]MDW8207425.1 aminopeptidase [Chloroherpetonaceae bacterium]